MPEGVSLIREYGSFGALVCLAAWFCGWVVPRLLLAFKEQADLFRKEQEEHRKAASADREADRKAAAEQHANCHEANRAVADVLSGLVDEVKRLGGCRFEPCRLDDPGDSGVHLGTGKVPPKKQRPAGNQ